MIPPDGLARARHWQLVRDSVGTVSEAECGLKGDNGMRQYLQSGLVKVGLALLVLGTGPLVLIIVLSAVGLLADPNPNPVGPGLLACLTFWPGVVCLILGIVRAARRRS
jgi:hypothetical protein